MNSMLNRNDKIRKLRQMVIRKKKNDAKTSFMKIEMSLNMKIITNLNYFEIRSLCRMRCIAFSINIRKLRAFELYSLNSWMESSLDEYYNWLLTLLCLIVTKVPERYLWNFVIRFKKFELNKISNLLIEHMIQIIIHENRKGYMGPNKGLSYIALYGFSMAFNTQFQPLLHILTKNSVFLPLRW